MKNQALTQTVKFAQGTLGILHVVAQSTADLIMEAEANIVNKAIGTDKEEVRVNRLTITVTRQQAVLDRISKSRQFVAQAEARMQADTKE